MPLNYEHIGPRADGLDMTCLAGGHRIRSGIHASKGSVELPILDSRPQYGARLVAVRSRKNEMLDMMAETERPVRMHDRLHASLLHQL